MEVGRVRRTLFAGVFLFGVGAATPRTTTAQPAEEDVLDIPLDIPGMGPVRLRDFPPEMREYVRIPGVDYNEPPEQYGDLPVAPFPSRPDFLPPPTEEEQRLSAEQSATETPAYVAPEGLQQPPSREERKSTREENLKKMYDERAFPGEKIPERAYQKAWEQIQQMQQGQPPPPPEAPTPAPESWLSGAAAVVSRWWGLLSPWQAVADTPPPPWTQIGPAPFKLEDGTTSNAGILGPIAVDSRGVIYTATAESGVWKSADAGASWVPLMIDQPSLQIGAIAIHPADDSVILAGTGVDANIVDVNAPEKAVGILRSIDGGAHWAQIGPTCTTDAVHDAPCLGADTFCYRTDSNPLTCPDTVPTKSAVAIGQIAIEGTVRTWAATSKGLWYSTNAHDRNTAPSNVVWNRATSLPNRSDGPDQVNHIFLSPWSTQVLYASIKDNDDGTLSHNGWWKSANGGTSWTNSLRLPNGHPSGDEQNVTRAAIAKSGQQGTDILYSIRTNVDVGSGCGHPPHDYRSRLERTTDSGGSWAYISQNPIAPECDFIGSSLRSVQVDPTPSILAVGAVGLYRSTDAGASFTQVDQGLHEDHNALTFTSHDMLYDGNDGGIWRTANFSNTVPNWSNLNGNGLANIEFYRGAIDSLNYGVSLGGTQDNGEIKGGTPLVWSHRSGGDATGSNIIDPTNSNFAYWSNFQGSNGIYRTTDGGLSFPWIGDPATNLLPYKGIAETSLAMDPSANGGNKVLVVYSTATIPTPGMPQGQKYYRTTNADAPTPADVRWTPISTGTPPAPRAIAIAPAQTAPSNLIFAVSIDAVAGTSGIWRTSDAATWTVSSNGLPNRTLTSIAIDTSQACTASACTLYVTTSGFEPTPTGTQTPVPSHIFRTVFSRADQNWTQAVWENISGIVDTCTSGICPATGAPCVNGACPYYFPNVPANKIVFHPSNPNYVYVGSDLGVFQGALNGTVWKWDKFTNAFPQATLVMDLTTHAESGVMRAWTYGYSVWEVQAFAPPNPDRQVNTTIPVTTVQSPQLSNRPGSGYAVTWADDRNGANSWHVRYRTFNADGSPVGSADVPADDTTDHVAQAPAVADVNAGFHGQCSWVIWHDDRLDRGNHYNHIYYTDVCGDGYRPYANMRLDTQATNLNAIYPAVVQQPTQQLLASVASWQADRAAAPTPLHDIYIRRFSGYGPATDPIKVNPPPPAPTPATSDATFSALAADANDNTYAVWEEYEPGPNPPKEYKIFLSKYDVYLNLTHSAIRIDNPADPNNPERHAPSVTVDNQSGVNGPVIIVAWYEKTTGGPEYVVRRRLEIPSSTSVIWLDSNPVRVNDPPSAPAGVNRAAFPSVATDANNNFLVAWQANVNNVNNPTPTPNWNAFGKSYNANATPTPLKRDFRIDLAGRSSTGAPRVTRSSQAGKFAYAWRDNRLGASSNFSVYTRVAPSM